MLPFISSGPAAVLGSRSSPPLLGGGGGVGGDPPCMGKHEVGTYIYSRLYTVHGALGTLL
jgi:hypothetical protein